MAQFHLPEIGEGVIEGEIVRWLKQPGESVASNEALIEVMTDKATVEIPSPLAGIVVSHVANEGDICEVGAVLCEIDESGSAAAASAAPAAAAATASSSAPSAGPTVPATPAARALARETGIDLASLPVDERGRITKSDVMQARDGGYRTPAPAPAAPPAPAAAPAPTATPDPIPAPVARTAPSRDDEYIPFRGMRRIIAEGMTRSYSTAVHYTYVEQINVTKLVKLRKDAKDAAKEQGVSLSYLPFIIKAVCHALKKFPIVNATLDEANQRIVLRKRYHIGMAAATDAGLMVPVIKDADQLSLLDIGREVARLGAAAKVGKVARDELTGSTFSITSLGTIGGVLATPIINFPEVGILGVHAIRKTPIVNENDEIVVGHMMNLSVSLDHRVVDGYEGASFLQEVRRYLEDPNLLLLASI